MLLRMGGRRREEYRCGSSRDYGEIRSKLAVVDVNCLRGIREKEGDSEKNVRRKEVRERDIVREKDKEEERKREYHLKEKEFRGEGERKKVGADKEKYWGKEKSGERKKERDRSAKDLDRDTKLRDNAGRHRAGKDTADDERDNMGKERDYRDKQLADQEKKNRTSNRGDCHDTSIKYVDKDGHSRILENDYSRENIQSNYSRILNQKDEVEILAWVKRSRERDTNAEKAKASRLSKVFEEQEMNMIIDVDSDDHDEEATQHTTDHLGGSKVVEGGEAVVLTLKDQSIVADGDSSEDHVDDMLQHVQINGDEQKLKDEAHTAAAMKKVISFYDEPAGVEKNGLRQFNDDPVTAAGNWLILDSSGRPFSKRKLEELHTRIQGVSDEDPNSTAAKITTGYYTQEEMLNTFKNPKKKKSLRKKEKLDIDALEAEAIAAGLGIGDLGSRKDANRRPNLGEEQQRIEAEMRSNAYQPAYAKAEKASTALLHQEQVHAKQSIEEDDTPSFADDDYQKSLDRARKIALKRQSEEEKSGPQSQVTKLLIAKYSSNADINSNLGSSRDQPVVFTEMEEFVWGLQQLDQEEKRPNQSEDVVIDEGVASDQNIQMRDEDGRGWTTHESPIGKGLAGALKFLKDRGTLKQTKNEWGDHDHQSTFVLDEEERKFVVDDDHRHGSAREIRIDRTDEFGRDLTLKEAFRQLSHKFHGKGPGKRKQEKRMRQYKRCNQC